MTLYKYPRTYHLPWSFGTSSDDKVLKSVSHFVGKEVVVSEKLDGECTGMTRDKCHARSLDSKDHPSRHHVKKLHSEIAYQILAGWKFFGENVYARHSIQYRGLTSYFYLFGIYNDENVCLSWDETLEYAGLLGLNPVPVLYRGPWDERRVQACWTGKSVFDADQEGYVVRLAAEFKIEDFAVSVAKLVRAGHVQTSNHWMAEKVVPNLLYNAEKESTI